MGVGRARDSGQPHFWRDGVTVSCWNSSGVISARSFLGEVAVQGPSTMLKRSWVGACKKTEGLGVGSSNYHVVQVLLITVMVKSHFAVQIFVALGCVLFLVDFLLDFTVQSPVLTAAPGISRCLCAGENNNIQQHWHLVADEKWLRHATVAKTSSSSCVHHPPKYGDAQRDEYRKSGNREVKRQGMHKGVGLLAGWAVCVDNPAAC